MIGKSVQTKYRKDEIQKILTIVLWNSHVRVCVWLLGPGRASKKRWRTGRRGEKGYQGERAGEREAEDDRGKEARVEA